MFASMNREQYENPSEFFGFKNLSTPDIVKRENDPKEIQVNFKKWNALDDFEDEDVSDQFVKNSNSEGDAVEDVIEKRICKHKKKASAKHRKKKRHREDKVKRHKKIKHEIDTFDRGKSSRKKRRHSTKSYDSGSEVEEGEIPRRRTKRYRSPSPSDDYCEKDHKETIKKESEEVTCPAASIKQESPSVQGMYHCDICDITLNSDITYQSHIAGKKHKKKLDAKNVAQATAEPFNDSLYAVSFSELFESYSHPDTSKAGFYCSVCNSHSNSSSMWEAHIIGKRHIANLKKPSFTAPSKNRYVPAPPGTEARLKSQLKYVREPVVGLDQIREMQRLDSGFVSYTCFLCGGIPIWEDKIVEHILLPKHREKYLEQIRYPGLETIRNFQMSVRDCLLAELCEKVEAEQGRGKPEGSMKLLYDVIQEDELNIMTIKTLLSIPLPENS